MQKRDQKEKSIDKGSKKLYGNQAKNKMETDQNKEKSADDKQTTKGEQAVRDSVNRRGDEEGHAVNKLFDELKKLSNMPTKPKHRMTKANFVNLVDDDDMMSLESGVDDDHGIKQYDVPPDIIISTVEATTETTGDHGSNDQEGNGKGNHAAHDRENEQQQEGKSDTPPDESNKRKNTETSEEPSKRSKSDTTDAEKEKFINDSDVTAEIASIQNNFASSPGTTSTQTTDNKPQNRFKTTNAKGKTTWIGSTPDFPHRKNKLPNAKNKPKTIDNVLVDTDESSNVSDDRLHHSEQKPSKRFKKRKSSAGVGEKSGSPRKTPPKHKKHVEVSTDGGTPELPPLKLHPTQLKKRSKESPKNK